jgi:FtsH-binding integral membrane protein
MNEHPVSPLQKQMPRTAEDHRRQIFWQVWVPLAAAILIFLALAVWASVATARNSTVGAHFADVSAIYVFIPMAIVGLVCLIILAAIIYGLAKLLQVLPIYSLRARAFFYIVEAAILNALDKISQPFLAIDSAWSGLDNFLKHFRKSKS